MTGTQKHRADMEPWINQVELEGDTIKLVPLTAAYRDQLVEAASDGKLWELWYTSVPSEATIDSYLGKAIRQREKGIEYPFVIIDKKSVFA